MGRSKKSEDTVKGSATNSPTPMETASAGSPKEAKEAELKHVKRPRTESESGSEAGNARKRGQRTKAEVAEEMDEMRKNGCLV